MGSNEVGVSFLDFDEFAAFSIISDSSCSVLHTEKQFDSIIAL
jgi:hypothetical protein